MSSVQSYKFYSFLEAHKKILERQLSLEGNISKRKHQQADTKKLFWKSC